MNKPRRKRNATSSRTPARIFFALSSLQGFLSCRHNSANASIAASKTHPSSASTSSSSTTTTTTTAAAAVVAAAGRDSETNNDPSSAAAFLERTSSKNQNPYVTASPLSVAAVCSDGIALVSLHYVDDLEEEEEEQDSTADDNASSHSTDNQQQQQQQQQITLSNKFRDLPLSSRGPLRIEPIYENTSTNHQQHNSPDVVPPPMSLLTAGWRTDGMTLSDAARELMNEEVRLYCLDSMLVLDNDATAMCGGGSGSYDNYGTGVMDGVGLEETSHGALVSNAKNGNHVIAKKDAPQNTIITGQQQQQQQPYYGRRIAEGLSYYLSKCVFSEGVRSLSTIGLLACGSSSGGGGRGGRSLLYLIDATGTHRVRAHAIGNGSSALHSRLAYVDFSTMDCQEGLRVLLRLIAEEGGLVPRYSATGGRRSLVLSEEDGGDKDGTRDAKSLEDGKTGGGNSVMAKPAFVGKGRGNQRSSKEEGESAVSLHQGRQQQQWNLPSNIATELAVLKNGEGRMRRVRLSTLFV